jgi:hypothetical protein
VPPVRPDGAQRDLLESSVEVVAVDFVRQNAATLTRLFRHFSVRGAVVHAAASDKREEVCSPSVQHPYYTAAHPLSVILTRLTHLTIPRPRRSVSRYSSRTCAERNGLACTCKTVPNARSRTRRCWAGGGLTRPQLMS